MQSDFSARLTRVVFSTILIVLVCPAAISAQEVGARESDTQATPAGAWLAGSVVLGSALPDRRSALPWDRVGHFGLSTGGALSLGYDRRRFGLALDIDALRSRVGERTGSNLAVAAVARWMPTWQPFETWNLRVSSGYVRYGLGGAPIMPEELPPDLFRSGNPTQAYGDPRLSLLGNGARFGLSGERILHNGTTLIVSLGGDVVRFESANYQSYELTLSQPGWAVIPRLAVGVRVHPFR